MNHVENRVSGSAPAASPSLGFVLILAITIAGFGTVVPVKAAESAASDWTEADKILARVVAPTFPTRRFAVTDFGAKADGITDCRDAFAGAISACAKAGGGHVVVPPGGFFCNGPIHLQSNIDLHFEEGATIKFGAEPDRYLPVVLTRFEGTRLMGHSPRIYAYNATNVAITGHGTIDGNATGTFAWFKAHEGKGNASQLRQMGAEGVPVEKRLFGEGRWLRPSMIQPYDCTNVLIEGVTIRDSTFWVVHPVLCRNVTVRGITVDSMNGNNDGCDPDSCSDVLIENCDFHTGDDAIAIKSGRDQDGWAVGRASENIVIRHCTMRSKWSALCIGSEMSGGVRNVFMEDCRVVGAASAFYFKANLDRGGLVEHVRARHLTVDTVREPLVRFETGYHGWRGENHPPSFRDFVIEDLSCQNAETYAVYVEGVAAAPIRDVVIRRLTVEHAEAPLWLKRVENIRLENVKVNGRDLPATPPLTPDSEKKLKMSS